MAATAEPTGRSAVLLFIGEPIRLRPNPGKISFVTATRTSTMSATRTATQPVAQPSAEGEAITLHDGRLQVPASPIIPFIEGDGTGPDIWRASQLVFDG